VRSQTNTIGGAHKDDKQDPAHQKRIEPVKIHIRVDRSEAALQAVRNALHLWGKAWQVILAPPTLQALTCLYELALVHDSDAFDKVTVAVSVFAK